MKLFRRLIERPPLLFRILFPEAMFRLGTKEKCVYLTFDDGPIPEVTPRVLDVLDRYGVKATFFMVGDNARRHPELVAEVLRRGHIVGNHTMHHLKGAGVSTKRYLADIHEADRYIASPLFRPPHGLLRWKQAALLKREYTLIMYDLITRDYSRHLSGEDVIRNVKHYSRPGGIIVFHDSLKSLPRLFDALGPSIEWLQSEGYVFRTLSSASGNGGETPMEKQHR